MSFYVDDGHPVALTPQSVHYNAFRETSLVVDDSNGSFEANTKGPQEMGSLWSTCGVGFSQLSGKRFQSRKQMSAPTFYNAQNRTIGHEQLWNRKIGSAQTLRSKSPRFAIPRPPATRDLVYDCSRASRVVRPSQRNQAFRREKRHGSILLPFQSKAMGKTTSTARSTTVLERDFDSWSWKSNSSRSTWSAKGATFATRESSRIRRRPRASIGTDIAQDKNTKTELRSARKQERELELLSLMKEFWSGRMSRSELDKALNKAKSRHRREDRANGTLREPRRNRKNIKAKEGLGDAGVFSGGRVEKGATISRRMTVLETLKE